MKLAPLSALSAAAILANSAQAHDFFEDASFDICLKQFHYTKENDADGDKKSSQWAQGFLAQFESGYFEDIVGLDLGAYYSLKLGASHNDTGNDLLQVDGDGNSHSYGKTSYAVKFNLMDMGVAKYGRMKLDTPLVNDSGSRVLPSLTEAFYADIAYENLEGYVVHAKKGTGRTDAGFENYEVNGDKEAVDAFGLIYDFDNGLALSADYAKQSEFAKKYLAEATYLTEAQGVGLELAAQYAKMDLTGYNKNKASAEEDTDASAYGLAAIADLGAVSVGLAYTKVSRIVNEDVLEHSFNPEWSGGDDKTSYFGYNASQISDFNRSNQKAWGLHTTYDFYDTIEGLEAGVSYMTGDYKGGDEKEYNIAVSYEIPQVDGLTATWKYAENKNDADGSNEVKKTDNRIYVEYNVAVF